tara:strand:+ start:2365 stop:2973 length:609 start_codon:yes stop_codon:yes gene_type:complete
METFLLFTTGKGSDLPLARTASGFALLSSLNLISAKPFSNDEILLTFTTALIKLKVRNGSQIGIIKAIIAGINSSQKTITVIDKDSATFIHPHILDVEINHSGIITQTEVISNNSATVINIPTGRIKKLVIANTDGTDAVNCTLEILEGSTYYKILSTVSIPANTSLVLEEHEISFDELTFSSLVRVTSGDANGQLTLKFNF